MSSSIVKKFKSNTLKMAYPVYNDQNYRRDSFDRFGDDLHSFILSFLAVDDQYRLLLVSTMFLNNMFTQSHFVQFNSIWNSPLNVLELTDLKMVNKAMNAIAQNQNQAIRKVYFQLEHLCMRCIALFYDKCKNLTCVKIDAGTRKTLSGDCIGEILHFIRLGPKIKEIHFNFMVNFNSQPFMQLFIAQYRSVLREFGFTYGTANHVPIQENLHSFPHLTTLNIGYYNNQNKLRVQTLRAIAGQVPNLKRLIIYRIDDKVEDFLFNIRELKKMFKNLDYYYIGPMSGGLWETHDFLKPTMNDMYKFQTLRTEVQFAEPKTIVYYSRKHRFIYYNQRDQEHTLVISDDVRSLAYNFVHVEYRLETDARNVIRLMRMNPNIVHLRVRIDCFTPRLVKYLVNKANENPNTDHCFATRNISPIGKQRNVWTNVTTLIDSLN